MKKRGKYRKTLLIIPAAVIILAAALLIINANQPPLNPEKKQSSEYFVISGAAATGRHLAGTNATVLIDLLGFNFTPVGGDAREVTLFLEGKTDPLDFFWEQIPNGTSTFSGEISPPFGLVAQRQSGGYLLQMRIFSLEADGDVNVTIPDDSIFLSNASV